MIFLMQKIHLVASLIACLSVVAIPSQVQARQICNEIARDAEKAYNNFQAADARGDESAMAKYYVRFQGKVSAYQSHGCP